MAPSFAYNFALRNPTDPALALLWCNSVDHTRASPYSSWLVIQGVRKNLTETIATAVKAAANDVFAVWRMHDV